MSQSPTGGFAIGGFWQPIPLLTNLTAEFSSTIKLSLNILADNSDNTTSAVLSLTMRATARTLTPDPLWLKSIVPQFIPQFIFEDHPRFVTILEDWCDVLERKYMPDGSDAVGPWYPLKYFDQLVDLDGTQDELLEWFKSTFAVTIPKQIAADTKLLIKNAVKFYLSRGTKDSVRFLLNSFFGDNTASVYEPKIDLLRASDGTWYQPKQIALNAILAPASAVNSTVLSGLYDQLLTCEVSSARAYVGQIGSYGLTDVIELLDTSGNFVAGDIVRSSDGRQFVVNNIGIVRPPGKWLTTDSFLSSDKVVQDSFYWQDFSYEITSELDIQTIKGAIARNTHPAGLLNFVKTVIRDYMEFGYDDILTFEKFTILSSEVLDDAPLPETVAEAQVEYIESHLQDFIDWSSFYNSLSAGENDAHDVDMEDLDEWTSERISNSLQENHVTVNWSQKFIPADSSGFSTVQIDLDSLEMSEYDDVPLNYVERLQLTSYRGQAGFQEIPIGPFEANSILLANTGTAPMSDRCLVGIVSGVVNVELRLTASSNDIGILQVKVPAINNTARPSAINNTASIMVLGSGSGSKQNDQFDQIGFLFNELDYTRSIDNAIVLDAENNKMLLAGFDYHINGSKILFSNEWLGAKIFIIGTNIRSSSEITYKARFNASYQMIVPPDDTYLDFVKTEITIGPP